MIQPPGRRCLGCVRDDDPHQQVEQQALLPPAQPIRRRGRGAVRVQVEVLRRSKPHTPACSAVHSAAAQLAALAWLRLLGCTSSMRAFSMTIPLIHDCPHCPCPPKDPLRHRGEQGIHQHEGVARHLNDRYALVGGCTRFSSRMATPFRLCITASRRLPSPVATTRLNSQVVADSSSRNTAP